MVIDLKNARQVDSLPTGARGFISYARLVEQLRRAGEVRQNETITHLNMTPEGVSYAVEYNRRD